MNGALALILAAGGAWSLLCLVLAAGGHAPSATLIPIPREHYYLAQAAFVMPVLLLCWRVSGAVAHRVAGWLGGTGSETETLRRLAPAVAVPVLLLLVVPDLVVYVAFGFEALARAVRVTAPLSTLVTLVLATLAVRSAHAVSSARALGAALAGLVVQALVGGALLR